MRIAFGCFTAILSIAAMEAQTPIAPSVESISFPGIASPVLYGLGRPASVVLGTPLYPVRSGDGGKTWLPLYVFQAGTIQNVTGIAVDSSNPDTVYVSAQLNRGGIWKSTDGGQSWTQRATGLPTGSSPVENLTVAANNPQVLYVKIDNLLFKSTDGAATWAEHASLPTTLPGHRLTLLPTTPTQGYFAARGGGVFRSTDDGRTWTFRGGITVQNGLTEANARSRCVTIDPSDPNHVYVCLDVDAGSGLTGIWGFWRSADGGATWRNVYETPQTPAAGNVFIDPRGGNVVHLQVGYSGRNYARSANRGVTFTERGQLLFPIALDPRNPDLLYGSGANRLSRDAGLTAENIDAIFRPTFLSVADPVFFQLEVGQDASSMISVATAESPGAVGFTTSITGAPWLRVTTVNPTTATGIRVSASAVGLAPGTYEATIQLLSTQTIGPGAFPVRLIVTPLAAGPTYTVSTIYGGGSGSATPDGMPAAGANLGVLDRMAIDRQGRIYFNVGARVRVIDGGTLRAFAGTGQSSPVGQGGQGDGGPATTALFSLFIDGIAVDAQDRVYISDSLENRVRVVEDGVIRTLFSQANQVQGRAFLSPRGLDVAPNGDLYIASASGIVRAPAGENRLEVLIAQPLGAMFVDVKVAADGTAYYADQTRHQVFQLRPGTAAVAIAGTGTEGFSGDGGPGTQAQLNRPIAVELDRDGNVWIIDSGNRRIRVVTPDGIIRTVAGGGNSVGNNVGATDSLLLSPTDLVFDAQGNALFAQFNAIRRLTKDTAPRPRTVQGSFVNAGSNLSKLSPGSLFSLYGRDMAAATEVAMGGPWPTTLGGATVRINGNPVPLFYASPTQINGQVPYDLRIGANVAANVTANGLVSGDVTFRVLASSPGILVFGDNRAVVVNPDGSVNTSTTPAKPRDVLVGYFVGTGLLDNAVATGAAAPADPLSRPALPVKIYVGEFESRVIFVGLTPGFIGLAQANFEVPDLPPGDYTVVIVIGDEASNGPVITVGSR